VKSDFKTKAVGKSDIGRKRTTNQDSFLVDNEIKLFAVADGMGGHSGGEVASALAIKTLEKFFEENKKRKEPAAQLLRHCVELCNKTIYDNSQANPKLLGMGTTLTACVLDGKWLHIAQVGDSRCYIFRDPELFQITEDHSQVYEMLKAGLINEASMHTFHKNVITRSVGYEESVQVDICSRLILPGDRYLICSDGLTGMVSNEQIAQILHNFDLEQACQNLVDLANSQGGEDNISVILFETK